MRPIFSMSDDPLDALQRLPQIAGTEEVDFKVLTLLRCLSECGRLGIRIKTSHVLGMIQHCQLAFCRFSWSVTLLKLESGSWGQR
jgi:hypothetical protein